MSPQLAFARTSHRGTDLLRQSATNIFEPSHLQMAETTVLFAPTTLFVIMGDAREVLKIMDNKPKPQEAFTLPRAWLAEILLSSLDFGRNNRKGSMVDGLTDTDLVQQYLEFLDAACEHHGTTDLAAAQKANKLRCYVKFVGSQPKPL